MRAQLANGVNDCVVESSLALSFGETLFVWLQISKLERVRRAKAEVDQLVAGFEEIFDACSRVDAEVMAALRADVLVGFELGLEEDFCALGAADP
jgi:hypothetical protein